MLQGAGLAPVLAQTLVEYGLMNTISARLAAAQYRLEEYMGRGNTKYFLLALLVLFLLFLIKRRR